MSNQKKKKWLFKIIKALSAVISVSGIIAIINFYNQEKERKEVKYNNAVHSWQSDLNDWNHWSPKELGEGEYTFYVNGFDLDSGEQYSNFNKQNIDLLFYGGDRGFDSYFRALNGTKWINKGLINIDSIRYSELRDAKFNASKHPKSNYYDLFHEHPSNSPTVGYTYFIKTKKGNLSIVQIKKYDIIKISKTNFSRKMTIWFKTYPNIKHPTKPISPLRP